MEMARGVHLGLLLICLLQVERVSSWDSKVQRPSGALARLGPSRSEPKPNWPMTDLNQEISQKMPLQIFGFSTALIGGGSFNERHQAPVSRETWSDAPSTGNNPPSLLDDGADEVEAARLTQRPPARTTTRASSRRGSDAPDPAHLLSPTNERSGNASSGPEAGNRHPEVHLKAGQAQQSYAPASAPHATFSPPSRSQSTAPNEATAPAASGKIYRQTAWSGTTPAPGARYLPASRAGDSGAFARYIASTRTRTIPVPGGHAIIRPQEPGDQEKAIHREPTGAAPGRLPVPQQDYVAPQRPSTQQQDYMAPQRPSTQQQAPQRPSTQQQAPQRPSTQQQGYVAPQRPSTQQQAPQRPSTQQQAPQRPSTQQQAPQRPLTEQQDYVAPQWPSAPQQDCVAPRRRSAQQQGYVAPQRPLTQQQAPQRPSTQQQGYVAPQRPSTQQQAPQRFSTLQQDYVAPQRPSTLQEAYVAPPEPSASYRPAVQRVHPKTVWKRIRLGKISTS
ncbi:DNA translocase FtsK-like [Pungitius pungitius]|uniref:DNA translocase FtsK-like n=1 Tax=Pungitius pungitius TaxID=134920 RepID=UPI002E11E75D